MTVSVLARTFSFQRSKACRIVIGHDGDVSTSTWCICSKTYSATGFFASTNRAIWQKLLLISLLKVRTLSYCDCNDSVFLAYSSTPCDIESFDVWLWLKLLDLATQIELNYLSLIRFAPPSLLIKLYSHLNFNLIK